jgi:hypothetical protein
MKNLNLMGEGGPIYTQDETIAIPPTASNYVKNSPERLCEYNDDLISGCRRTNQILALEAEFDTFVHPEMVWGEDDQFCIHEKYTFFYKKRLEFLAKQEDDNYKNVAEALKPLLEKVKAHLGYELKTDNPVDFIKSLFTGSIPGLPPILEETPQFYKCMPLGKKLVIDDINRQVLDRIRDTFTNDLNPLLENLTNHLYIGEEVYCPAAHLYEYNPTAKYGIFLTADNSSKKYIPGKTYFFPFGPMTSRKKEFIYDLGKLDSENQQLEVEIVIF